MLEDHDTQRDDTQPGKARTWSRLSQNALLRGLEQSGLSVNAFCQQFGLSRSTFRDWLKRRRDLREREVWVEFFESEAGVVFMHRLMVAVHLVFSCQCAVGAGMIRQFFELLGLAPFMALSDGYQHKYSAQLNQVVIEFGALQTSKLVRHHSTAIPVVLAIDETYHERPCLVAMEPTSGFVFAEHYSERTTKAAWLEALKPALTTLPIEVVGTVSDQGKAVIAVAKALDVPQQLDLFHQVRELNRQSAKLLRVEEKRAKVEAIKARQAHRKAKTRLDQADAESPAYDLAIRQTRLAHTEALKTEHRAEELDGVGDEAFSLLLQWSDFSHPVSIQTGELQHAETVQDDLKGVVSALSDRLTAAGLAASAQTMLHRAEQWLKARVANVSQFELVLAEHARRWQDTTAGSTAEFERAVEWSYLERISEHGRTPEERTRRRALAKLKRKALEHGLAAVDRLGVLAELTTRADTISRLFCRSSSCVEGRNGRLRLLHHGRHILSGPRLKALTTIHNFWTRRKDATTAAERLFACKPPSLFEFLVDRLPFPARPRRKSCSSLYAGTPVQMAGT